MAAEDERLGWADSDREQRARLLNELAQGRRPVEDGLAWFAALTEAQARTVLRELVFFILQSGARTEDVAASVAQAGIKPTATPAVMLARPNLPVRLGGVVNLIEPEMRRAFPLLVALFAVADGRRRETACSGACSHWWHNLDEPDHHRE